MRFSLNFGRRATLAFAFVAGVSAPALAEQDYVLTLKDNAFVEQELHVPTDTPFVLTVVNMDATPEEFESDVLHIEKIVPGGKSVTIRVGPLAAGEYPFFGEFHEDTAFGTLIVGSQQ